MQHDKTMIDTNFNDKPHVSTKRLSTDTKLINRRRPLSPSIRLLFSLVSRRHVLSLLLPAVCSSIIAGCIAPFMTQVVGQAFDAFARFAQSPSPPSQSIADNLLHEIGLTALQLIGLAVGSLALSSVTSCLWIWTGEMNTMALRKKVYRAVTTKEMAWFDLHLSSEDFEQEQNSLGAGGLMAKFTRETDDVRTASSLASGLLLQHLTTALACLLLAFVRSYQLTLVILASVPILTLIQGFSQQFAAPLLENERKQSGIAATLIERATSFIATVKSFNAVEYEHARASNVFTHLRLAARKLNTVWAFTSATAQFVMMGMFVQGFWFGGKLVREGKASPGDVMAVFWACLLATSNLQMCIPQFIALTKGKLSMVALLELIGDEDHVETKNKPLSPPLSPLSPVAFHPPAISHPAPLFKSSLRATRKLVSSTISFDSVTFSYPTRPQTSALSSVSLHFPAKKTTFVVGSSGSGKSTIAQLLIGLYEPQEGDIAIDNLIQSPTWPHSDHERTRRRKKWMKEHVTCIGQDGVVILEGKTILENVACAATSAAFVPHTDSHHKRYSFDPKRDSSWGTLRQPVKITRKEVEEACRATLLHDFVRDLPDGYDTVLSSGSGGSGGVTLSGGQKQRLALARAWLIDPTVLVLDEATSALDATSRLLVFEALKVWRKDKTTIVITHDLTQIEPSDYVYVMKSGRVVEHGSRKELEQRQKKDGKATGLIGGEFRMMLEASQTMKGTSPPDIERTEESTPPPMLDPLGPAENNLEVIPQIITFPSLAIRPFTWGMSSRSSFSALNSSLPSLRPSSSANFVNRLASRDQHATISKRYRHVTLNFMPLRSVPNAPEKLAKIIIDDDEFLDEKDIVERSGARAREGRHTKRIRHDLSVKLEYSATSFSSDEVRGPSRSPPSFLRVLRTVYPSIPHKPLFFFGLLTCLVSGALTPFFSFLLARLLFEISSGATNVSAINIVGGIVLAVSALDGIFLGLKYWLMETSAMYWVTAMRDNAFRRVLAQDKKYFDSALHGPAHFIQVLIKDGDDARDFLAIVVSQSLVVGAMLGVGLTWAITRGWELTLAGFAIAPIFVGVMVLQTKLVGTCESRNREAREEVARGYYQSIVNIRAIRCMSLNRLFDLQFHAAVEKALITGVKGAFVEGCTYGVASGLIYLAEALLFYVGAVLIANGRYSYLQMMEVLNLVVFSVTIGSQLMAFTERIAKSVQATSAFDSLMNLDTKTDESRGVLRPLLSGSVRFQHVQFAYPEQPDVATLKSVNLEVLPGECVAFVGSSGSGKSTIAALLQRLYEPSSGSVTIGSYDLSSVNIQHLREHISIVSQHPHLFSTSIMENIRYGSSPLLVSDEDVRRAADAANVHDFIMSLPNGYDTPLGENAALISGGQAQRLQIARAFARRHARILVLDECTSALDPANQSAILVSIQRWLDDPNVGYGGEKMVLMITHNLDVMRACSRILVLDDGEVVEQGTYDELSGMQNGVFASLARGGEWVGSQ